MAALLESLSPVVLKGKSTPLVLLPLLDSVPQRLINGVSLTRPACVNGFCVLFSLYRSLFFSLLCTLVRSRRGLLSLERSLVFEPCSPYSLSPVLVHRCGVAHQASLRSVQTMMKRSISLAFREAGSLINRSMTVRTEPRFRHPHHRPHHLLASVRDDRTPDNRFHPAT